MLPWLDPELPTFPDTSQAFSEPNGLLAAGGALSPKWLLLAYQQGIFPWFNDGDPILWWTPSPRMVIYPHQFHISRSLRKSLRRENYQVTINKDFLAVIAACAEPRNSDVNDSGTWISSRMKASYHSLHQQGYAHSIEAWREGELIGGLYGVALGKVFFGESMFSKQTSGSKIALTHLVEWLKQWQYRLIDCQIYNDHLSRLGAIEIDRPTFEQILNSCVDINIDSGYQEQWQPSDITLNKNHWSKVE